MRVMANQGDTLDGLCYRYLGSTAGVVEQALELNRGLADLGAVLPHGTPVILPDSVPQDTSDRALIQLWD